MKHRTNFMLLTLAWECSRAQGSDLLVVLAIAGRGRRDAGGWTYASIDQLAADARLNRWTVMRALPELEKLGELEIRRRGGEKGRHEYRIREEALSAGGDFLPPRGGGNESPHSRSRGDFLPPGPSSVGDIVRAPRLESATASGDNASPPPVNTWGHVNEHVLGTGEKEPTQEQVTDGAAMDAAIGACRRAARVGGSKRKVRGG